MLNSLFMNLSTTRRKVNPLNARLWYVHKIKSSAFHRTDLGISPIMIDGSFLRGLLVLNFYWASVHPSDEIHI